MLNFEDKSDRRAILLFATAVIMMLFVANNAIMTKTSNIFASAVGNPTPSRQAQDIQIWVGGVLAGGATSALIYFFAWIIGRFTKNRVRNTIKIFTALSILFVAGTSFRIIPSLSILTESEAKQALQMRKKLENAGVDLSQFRQKPY